MSRILVVEDEADVRDLLVLSLKREGHEVVAFDHAEDAIPLLKNDSPEKIDLAILDWMLPRLSGLDLCKIIRQKMGNQIPVLMLTARADVSDKVLGLELGADDYLSKPFEMREFIARVRALLRRSTESIVTQDTALDQSVLTFYGLSLDMNRKSAYRNQIEIQLTPNEFKLLYELFKKPGFTYDRETLIRLIQGSQVSVVDRTIDTTILGLRKKLGDLADIIETVRGFGYRLKEEK